MKAVDRCAMEQVGLPSLVLQERAALCVAEEVKALLKKEKGNGSVWFFCGTGNNGADGIAAARILQSQGYPVLVVYVGDRARGTEEFFRQKKIAEELGVPSVCWPDMQERLKLSHGPCRMLVDALFGVGLSRPVEGAYGEAMEFMKELAAETVLSVDIPSGIHSDTGQVMGTALKADVTVTFGYKKLGMLLYPGKEYAGRVLVEDIGFPVPEILDTKLGSWYRAVALGPEDLSRMLPCRPEYSNKGTFGKVLVVAGSREMGGAAFLSALSAYRMGAGLVKVMTVEENRTMLQQLLPEAILTLYGSDEILKEPENFHKKVEEVCAWADVIVLGPGIGQGPETGLLVREFLTNAYVPVVLDADGLNAIAREPGLCQYFTENIILTPHLGEMSRLTGLSVERIRADLLQCACSYSTSHGVTCVLKDAVTVISGREGQLCVNESGNSCMAKAGSGDVLTGILAGLLAQGMEMWEAACLGVYLHGAAGDRLREKNGAYGMLAHELCEEAAYLCDRVPAIYGC